MHALARKEIEPSPVRRVHAVTVVTSAYFVLHFCLPFHANEMQKYQNKSKIYGNIRNEWMCSCAFGAESAEKIEFFCLHDEERREKERKMCAHENCIGVSRNVSHGRPVASERWTACMLFVNKLKEKKTLAIYIFFFPSLCDFVLHISISHDTHFSSESKTNREKRNCNCNRNRNKSPVELALSWWQWTWSDCCDRQINIKSNKYLLVPFASSADSNRVWVWAAGKWLFIDFDVNRWGMNYANVTPIGRRKEPQKRNSFNNKQHIYASMFRPKGKKNYIILSRI